MRTLGCQKAGKIEGGKAVVASGGTVASWGGRPGTGPNDLRTRIRNQRNALRVARIASFSILGLSHA
jgi:hypothetical protein